VHDLALRRRAGIRTRRLATAAGYVGAELAKEAPYYLGAVGAVLFLDGVSAGDGIIFLGGANVGAAAYEYGLAQATRGLLRRTPAIAYASFEAEWDPRRYLADYYAAVEPDERHTIAYLVGIADGLPPAQSVLVFGAGPTVHHAVPFALRARVIDLSDFLPDNLLEIERWIARQAGAHDWRPFVQHALTCAGEAADDRAVVEREAQTRARIGRLLPSDLRRAAPLGDEPSGYDVVVSTYCADSATDDKATWALYMARIATLVRPGGLLVVAALRRCRGYRVGGRTFPSANIDEADLRQVLSPLTDALDVQARLLPERHGYSGILLASGRVRGDGRAAAP
jgi:hypothetical protein